MKIICIVSLAACSLFLGSCHYDGSGGSSGVIIPLKTGNQWIYQETTTDSLGHILETTTDTASVGLSVSIDGIEWFFFTGPGDSPFDATLSTNKNDGFWIHGDQGSGSLLFIPYPAAPGYDYLLASDTSFFDTTISQTRIKIKSANELVNTKKRLFFLLPLFGANR